MSHQEINILAYTNEEEIVSLNVIANIIDEGCFVVPDDFE